MGAAASVYWPSPALWHRTLLPMVVIAVVVSLSLSAQWVRRWRKEQADSAADTIDFP
ncbi:MAG: hypothetical protein R3D55_06615 [Chloroflexota bacterium]